MAATTKVVNADGVQVFYREGISPNKPDAPVILLLHGFPSSSHQYRNLIPLLSHKYRVLAPDLPGFGFTKVPEERKYKYTFESLSNTIAAFLDALSVEKFSVYVFDYGAPTTWRLALKRPEAITAIISQNGNAYEEGLGFFWEPVRSFWATGAADEREALRKAFLNLPTTQWQYTHGTPSTHSIAPEAPYLDFALLERPGNHEIQMDLLYDYRENVKLYPQLHDYFKESQVPLLAVWGKNDEIFLAPGAEAFKKDIKGAEIVLLDAGHFAAESHTAEIAELMLGFLEREGIV
ncbi:putative soluble epoxide hydrolase [Coleophoma crateriformis]|uniref:Putative soluble epoxide hydrolase n=1 Tax=Coleophoma crateriformis TaxID=565419 RepID=A0A3D8SHC4_9HELO|nr:putative soluble epoxide hydrolase [Coleophoma crateriformis]